MTMVRSSSSSSSSSLSSSSSSSSDSSSESRSSSASSSPSPCDSSSSSATSSSSDSSSSSEVSSPSDVWSAEEDDSWSESSVNECSSSVSSSVGGVIKVAAGAASSSEASQRESVLRTNSYEKLFIGSAPNPIRNRLLGLKKVPRAALYRRTGMHGAEPDPLLRVCETKGSTHGRLGYNKFVCSVGT